jgi:hypothetical protein
MAGRVIDPGLRAQLAAADSTAWTALRAWLSTSPADQASSATLDEVEDIVAGWPLAVRTAGADDWARIEGGGERPIWWPLVRTVTIDGWTALEPIDALLDMHSIRFQQRAQTNALARLGELPTLRELVVGGLGSEGLDALPPLPHLERLSATAESLPEDFAARFPALRSLSLANSSHLSRLPVLPGGLVDLDLSGCPRLEGIAEITACEALRSIDLSRCDALQDLSALARLPAIERIRLDARRARRLEPVGACASLRDLWIGAGGEAVDLRPLDKHTRLRALGLEGCTNVAGLAGLELPSLEELHVLRCGVAGLPELGASRRLRVLDLEGLPAIHALPLLGQGHVLELLRLIDMTGVRADVPRPAAHHTVEQRSAR